MNQYQKELLLNYQHYYQKQPGHSYQLIVVKYWFGETYNFFLTDLHGATYSYALVSIPFQAVTAYKTALKALLVATDLPIEYHGFKKL